MQKVAASSCFEYFSRVFDVMHQSINFSLSKPLLVLIISIWRLDVKTVFYSFIHESSCKYIFSALQIAKGIKSAYNIGKYIYTMCVAVEIYFIEKS